MNPVTRHRIHSAIDSAYRAVCKVEHRALKTSAVDTFPCVVMRNGTCMYDDTVHVHEARYILHSASSMYAHDAATLLFRTRDDIRAYVRMLVRTAVQYRSATAVRIPAQHVEATIGIHGACMDAYIVNDNHIQYLLLPLRNDAHEYRAYIYGECAPQEEPRFPYASRNRRDRNDAATQCLNIRLEEFRNGCKHPCDCDGHVHAYHSAGSVHGNEYTIIHTCDACGDVSDVWHIALLEADMPDHEVAQFPSW